MALIPIYWWTKEVHNFRISQDKFSKQPWAQGVVLLGSLCAGLFGSALITLVHSRSRRG